MRFWIFLLFVTSAFTASEAVEVSAEVGTPAAVDAPTQAHKPGTNVAHKVAPPPTRKTQNRPTAHKPIVKPVAKHATQVVTKSGAGAISNSPPSTQNGQKAAVATAVATMAVAAAATSPAGVHAAGNSEKKNVAPNAVLNSGVTASSVAIGSDNPCAEWAYRLPNVSPALCTGAALRASVGRSVQGRAIFTRDVLAPDAKLRVLVIGAIHGDEPTSSSLVLHWIQRAVETPSNAYWRFVPMLNPDGVMTRPWKRTNFHGVDLNRNFPTPNWEHDAKVYWEQRTKRDPRRWPGNTPLSEPESQYLHDEIDRFKPNLVVSIHAPYGVLDFDGPGAPPPKLGRLFLDQVGIYPGSLGNYSGVHKRIPVVTIELPNASRTPLDAEMRQMWVDLLRWMSEHVPVETANPKTTAKPVAALPAPVSKTGSAPPTASAVPHKAVSAP